MKKKLQTILIVTGIATAAFISWDESRMLLSDTHINSYHTPGVLKSPIQQIKHMRK